MRQEKVRKPDRRVQHRTPDFLELRLVKMEIHRNSACRQVGHGTGSSGRTVSALTESYRNQRQGKSYPDRPGRPLPRGIQTLTGMIRHGRARRRENADDVGRATWNHVEISHPRYLESLFRGTWERFRVHRMRLAIALANEDQPARNSTRTRRNSLDYVMVDGPIDAGSNSPEVETSPANEGGFYDGLTNHMRISSKRPTRVHLRDACTACQTLRLRRRNCLSLPPRQMPFRLISEHRCL